MAAEPPEQIIDE